MIEIIVVGTGMYTIGRGTDGYGTLVPAIHEWQKTHGNDVLIHLVGSNGLNNDDIRDKLNAFQSVSASDLKFKLWPDDDVKDDKAFLNVFREIQNPYCCFVAIPDHLHFDVAYASIENGIKCLVVKPLTPYYRDTKILADFAKEKKVYGCVEFHKRFDHANMMMRDDYRKGAIGIPLYSIVEYSQRVVIPKQVFRSWVETTNIFQYLGVHYVDIIKFVTGAMPVRVSATGQKSLLVNSNINTYDSIQCSIEWRLADGQSFMQSILVNWIDPCTSPAMSNQRIKLIGTKGRFESDQTNRGITIYSEDMGMNTPNPYFCYMYGEPSKDLSWKGYGIDSVRTFLEDCMAIENGDVDLDVLDSIRSTFIESVASSLVVEACNISLSRSGEWVAIEEIANEA